MLTVGSLFSGIGGIDLGLAMTGGFETKWFCEVDEYCVKVLNKHWPGVPVYGDVRELRGADIEPVDVLVGGFPCQPVSVAGRRKGDADDRWLWGEYVRLIREIRPRWVVAENVTGLRSIDDGRLFGTVLRDLAESGYDAEWDCIPASAVGAHHQRDRIWIVAYPNEVTEQEPQPQDHTICPQRDAWMVVEGSGYRRPQPISPQDVAHPRRRGYPRQRLFVNSGNPTSSSKGEATQSLNGGFGGIWTVEPDVGRVAYGIPNRVDRLGGLGNAVVPQVVEHIGRRILETNLRIST